MKHMKSYVRTFLCSLLYASGKWHENRRLHGNVVSQCEICVIVTALHETCTAGCVLITGKHAAISAVNCYYEGWNFNSGNYLFTTDTK